LILKYNTIDHRFHKLSLFLKKWRPEGVYFYPIQMMLLVYMQMYCCMPRLQETTDKTKAVNVAYVSGG
jgi:hypothetical protein